MKNFSKHSSLVGVLTASLFSAAAACSGNSSLGGGGTNSLGGSENQGGSGSSSGGTSSAATSNTTTTGNGGAVTVGGSASTGGDCGMIECFRAIECVEYCGGPVVSAGCCPCASGTFDQMTDCVGSGGSSSMGGTAAVAGSTGVGGATVTTGGACGVTTCSSNSECVAYCGGPIVSESCCPCAKGTFDQRLADCASSTGGSSSLGGASGAGGSTSLAGIHESCTTDGTCPSGLTPVKFYGVAGPSGPQFCNCEIPCTNATRTCPTDMTCQTVADGPGDVCY